MEKKYKIRLNSTDKVEELLQEIYDQACRQLNEIQVEINKLTNSTNLAEVDMDTKAKYSKAMHDFIGDKTKAISAKFEIAKFMGELIKHGGDADGALNDPNFSQKSKLDLKSLREALNSGDDSTKKYDLK